MSTVEELQAQLDRAKEHEALEANLAKAKDAQRDKPSEKNRAALHAAKDAVRTARSKSRTTGEG